MMATLAPCLVMLRHQFDAVGPDRDKATDGWIADAAHSSTSDHQPDAGGMVHAIDVDASGPWVRGLTMRDMVREVVDDHRAGRDNRLTYVIHDRLIAEASRGWTWRAYTGTNPHTAHAHFSCSRINSREQDTSPFHIEEDPVTTPPQNWAHDVDPGAGTYSAGGALWTVLARTGALTGAAGLPAVKAALDDLVADTAVDFDALAASLVYIKAGLDLLLADPFEIGEAHPLVQVHRYLQEHPTPPA